MLITLLLLFQLILFALGILGPWRDAPGLKNNGRLPRPIRMLLSFSLVVAAFVIWKTSYKQFEPYTRWVCFGMAASFLGDLIMARLIPLPNRLIGGMIAFAIAHALYINAYLQLIGDAIPNPGLVLGLCFYGLAMVSGWWFLICNPQKEVTINIGALAYGLLVSVMASFALALTFSLHGAFWLTALGGLFFFISDFIIGVTDIRGTQIKNANDWIWLTYVAGQMGIIYAGWLA